MTTGRAVHPVRYTVGCIAPLVVLWKPLAADR